MTHLLQWNTRGLLTKWPEFKGEILRTNPVLAALQETHFRDSDQWFKIPGYTWHTHNVNEQNRRGGAAILIANSVPHNRVAIVRNRAHVLVLVLCMPTYPSLPFVVKRTA